MFSNELRKKVLLEFFLEKNFFNLFLHWSYLIRKSYIYWIIYKMLRIDINKIQSSGFDNEFPFGTLILNDKYRFIQCSHEEYAIDLKIYGVMRGYIKMVGDYVKENPKLKVYATYALKEYKQLLNNYTSDYIPDIESIQMMKILKC